MFSLIFIGLVQLIYIYILKTGNIENEKYENDGLNWFKLNKWMIEFNKIIIVSFIKNWKLKNTGSQKVKKGSHFFDVRK